jgi:hypothetical protein
MTTITDGFTFIDTGGSAKSIVLPYPVGLGPKLYFIKDSGSNASINNITIAGRKDQNGNTVGFRVYQWSIGNNAVWIDYINGENTITNDSIIPMTPINQDSRCIILYNSGTDTDYYCIGDHIPEVDFIYVGSPVLDIDLNMVWKTANANTINLCNVIDNTAYVRLPSPQSGAICIIIATSTDSTRDVTLLIRDIENNSNTINGFFSGISLTIEGETVYPSVTFISNGANWYSIGSTGKNTRYKVYERNYSSNYFYGTTPISNPLTHTNLLFFTSTYRKYLPYIPASVLTGGITIGLNPFGMLLPADISSHLIIPSNTGPNYNTYTLTHKLSLNVIWYATISDNNATKYYPIILINGCNGGTYY